MKAKKLLLLTTFSLLCALGCACGGASQSESGESGASSMENSEPQSSVTVTVNPNIVLNHKLVDFCVGETFTLAAEAKNIQDASFVWTLDGDGEEGVVSLTQTGNSASITALKAGKTKLIASFEYNGHVYFESVIVTVKEKSDVTLVLSNNIGFDETGYHVRLSTLSTENGDETSIVPLVTAYQNNKIVSANILWESENPEVVSVTGNKFTSVAEGQTNIVGSCEIGGKRYTVNISAEVYRPRIVLDESFVIETENLSTITLSSSLKGIARKVVYNGERVGAYDANSKTVTLEKSALPCSAAQMGEDKEMLIETNVASYVVSVDMYTKILYTKADFDELAKWSKNANADAAIWDGYFVLGADIVYGGTYNSKIADLDSLWAAVGGNWSNGGLYGFKGVFDGKGHNIEGINIDKGSNMGSLFGVLHIDGVIKNLSFTKASVAANSSFVCHAGGGSVENVYVQYDSVGKGAQHYEGDGVTINSHCGTFFSFKEPTVTANIKNCVVDVTNAYINPDVSVKLIGSEFVSIKNAFVIGGTKAAQSASNATLCMDSVIDFMDNVNAQSRYKKFDENFWSLEGGIPVSKAVYNTLRDQEVTFDEEVECLVSGTSYKIPTSTSYAKIVSDNEAVTVKNGVATVAGNLNGAEKVTFTATSLFDSSKSDSFTCSLISLDKANAVDLTGEAEKAFYDITIGKVYFAELAEKMNGEILYCVNADGSAASYALDGEPAQAMLAVTKTGFYKFNCQSVTKVLSTAEDLHYIRKDYTVVDYGNKGCYDGVIKGTFVMINNIDASGLELKNTGRYWENSRGFGGTFDGRGYTISNLTVGENGLFGVVSYGTIKNVKFTNVRYKEADQGAYVALFGVRCFNATVENVSVEITKYISGTSVYHTSGLLFYEVTFDSLFKDITIDVSKVSGVKYVAECFYGADLPYRSEEKSVYEKIILIVATLDETPVFAYKNGTEIADDIIQYPDGFIVKDVDGNVA